MAPPQQPELGRSAKTDLDPDHIPADNQPGHHPAKEQDKPDLDAFAAKLGTDPKAPSATNARKPARPKPAAAKATSKQAPSKAASRPAAAPGRESPSAPPRIETTPAKRPAAAPAWPESAPAADDLGPLPDAPGISAPQPSPAREEEEPRMVALAMLPLRETVKRLEQLERTLSKRLAAKAGRGPRGR